MIWGLLVTMVSVLMPDPSTRINSNNYEKIKGGMHRRQVEEILGKPGDYRTDLNHPGGPASFSVSMDDMPLSELKWQTDDATVRIWISPRGEVQLRSYILMIRERTEMLDSLRIRLHNIHLQLPIGLKEMSSCVKNWHREK